MFEFNELLNIFRLADAVEFFIHTQKLSLCEMDAKHADHRSHTKNGEAAEHLHHALPIHRVANGRSAAFAVLFLCLHLFLDGKPKPKRPQLAADALQNIVEGVVE